MKNLITLLTFVSLIAIADDRPPIVYLPFDADMNDVGPYKHLVELHGDEIYRTEGLFGDALFVGGTEDWLDLYMDESIFLEGGASLELWFRRENWINPYKGGNGFQSLASVSTNLLLDITAEGCPVAPPWTLVATASFYLPGGEDDVIRAYTQPDVVKANEWIHAVLVYDAVEQSLTLYMNGKQIDKAYGVPVPSFSQRLLRLGTWHKANQAFKGYLDEVKVYDYPLAASQVKAIASQ